MLGAIIGDIVGSRFEWHNRKTKKFKLFTDDCHPTDDSVMTMAVAWAFIKADDDFSNLKEMTVKYLKRFGREYPHAGYGGRFKKWLRSGDTEPYNSFGNGAAMRVSPAAWVATDLPEAKTLSMIVTRTTHDHPEGIKGAEATTAAIFLAREGKTKEEIKEYICENYYDIDFTLDEIRDEYSFDVTCQGSVPQALEAFFESTDFEDAIRNAVSIGGDSDTIAAITGSIAEAYYGIPEEIAERALEELDDVQREVVETFREIYMTEE